MGFFDNLAASVSKTTREVSDGVKVLADKNRIRKDLATIESELRNRYRDIGQKFYDENKDNIPEAYAELFDSIVTLSNNLAAKQHELDAIDGTITCAACGKQLPKDTKFCSGCGATVVRPEVDAPRAAVCQNCGVAVAPDAAFCASCGNKVEAEVPAVPAAPANVCPNCGETLASDAIFCANCGTKAPGLE